MVSRRSFLGVLALAPIAAPALASMPIAPKVGRRISCVPGELGEQLYGECCGDGRAIKIFLDGIEQTWAEMADEAEGVVRRIVMTPEGNMAVNHATDQLVTETVTGEVRIEIGEPFEAGSRVFHFEDGRSFVAMPSEATGSFTQANDFQRLAADYGRVWSELDNVLPI